MPLYGNVSHEILTLNASQFEGASFYIPTISENDALHGKNLEIPDNSETNSDQESDTDNFQDANVRECDDISVHSSDWTQSETNNDQLVHKSKRIHKPTIKYL